MNEQLKEALAFDPIAEAERITGKSSKDDPSVVMLGLRLMHQHRHEKEALLFLNQDTVFGAKLDKQVAALESMGFKLVLSEPIPGTKDKWCIYWRDGALIFFDTFFGDGFNGGKCYVNYKGKIEGSPSSRGCVSYDEESGIGVFDGWEDVREGLRHKLEKMTDHGEILPVWVKRPFLWLLHYQDETPGYNHMEITESRIAMLPEEIRSAITPKEVGHE